MNREKVILWIWLKLVGFHSNFDQIFTQNWLVFIVNNSFWSCAMWRCSRCSRCDSVQLSIIVFGRNCVLFDSRLNVLRSEPPFCARCHLSLLSLSEYTNHCETKRVISLLRSTGLPDFFLSRNAGCFASHIWITDVILSSVLPCAQFQWAKETNVFHSSSVIVTQCIYLQDIL
jgi:hypothetical protein